MLKHPVKFQDTPENMLSFTLEFFLDSNYAQAIVPAD